MTAPLVVGYVGNFRAPWCTEVHVSKSLEALGHQVRRWQEDELDWSRLPDLAAGCHLVLWTRTWAVDNAAALAALARLRDMRVPTVSYHLDRWWGLDREYQVGDQPFFRTDLVVSPDGANDHRWAEASVNHLYLPPGVYAGECGETPPNPRLFPAPVVFVGSLPYPHKEWAPVRQGLVDAFRRHFGRRFATYPVAKGRPIRGRTLQALYATAQVVLGDSCLAGGATHYWSDRIPETLGRGGLLIHPETVGLDEWYVPGKELLTFAVGDHDAAIAHAEWALANPAEAREVATAGRERVLARDTYAHRMTTVLDHVEDAFGFGPGPLAAPSVARSVPTPETVRVAHRRHRGVRGEFALAGPDSTAVWEVWQDDTYRLDRLQIAGQAVVDIGAHVGSFAVLAAKLGATRVDAYEPVAAVHQVAERNVAHNGQAERVTVHHAAVGGHAGTAHMAVATDGGAHLATEGEEVPLLDINDVIGGPVGLLKIDCEGGEYDIIAGMTPETLQRVAHIVMEFHGPGMPHLRHLEGAAQWGPTVAKLAEYGHLRTLGRPSVGGLLWWDRY